MGDFEVRVTDSEVQVTEELETRAAEETLAAVAREENAVPDRTRAKELFERLATLPEGSAERERIRGALVELHLPLVEYLARRFRNRGEWLDDLTQVATIGLIKSIDRFDLERGVEFSTYATPTIVGEIKRHFRDKGWAVRVPRRLQELKLSLTKAIGDLAQREGRAPTVSELAAHLQMSEEEVLEGLESANAYSTVSLDAPDSGDEDAPAVADSLGIVDDALEGVEYRESLKPLLERLPPREKKILLLRFFGNMTQSQIAAELGISQMHVSRLLARTLTQLRAGLTSDELSGEPGQPAGRSFGPTRARRLPGSSRPVNPARATRSAGTPQSRRCPCSR
jgi:RNA polymerase sigma-B factor